MTSILKIPWKGVAHRGIVDSTMLSKICIELIKIGWIPK